MTMTALDRPIPTELQPLETLNADELRRELFGAIANIKIGLMHAANCVRLLDERKVDLSDVEPVLLSLLRKIATGVLLPDLAVRLLGHRDLVLRVVNCPKHQQERLAAEPTVVVHELRGDGSWDATRKPITKLSVGEIPQVFGPEGLRTDDEQRAWLHSRKEKVQAEPTPRVPIRILRDKKVVKVCEPCEVTLQQLKDWVKALS